MDFLLSEGLVMAVK